MNRQIRNVITSLMISAFAGIGLTAFAQSPSCCPEPVCAQPVCAQPVCAQPACPQPVVCCEQPTCGDPCLDRKDLVKRIEKNADGLRKHFKKSLECVDGCEAETYKENVKNFERATDRLRKDFDDCGDMSAQVREVLDLANCISAYMDPCSLNSKALADWTALRGDLETLAGEYCTTASFQQPVSLQPACVVQPVQVVQPVCCPDNNNH